MLEQDILYSAKCWFKSGRQEILQTCLKNCRPGRKASTQIIENFLFICPGFVLKKLTEQRGKPLLS